VALPLLAERPPGRPRGQSSPPGGRPGPGGWEDGQLPERRVLIGEVLRWPGEGADEVAAEALVGGHGVYRPAGKPAGFGAAHTAAEEAARPEEREGGAVELDAALQLGIERGALGQVEPEQGAQVGWAEQVLLVGVQGQVGDILGGVAQAAVPPVDHGDPAVAAGSGPAAPGRARARVERTPERLRPRRAAVQHLPGVASVAEGDPPAGRAGPGDGHARGEVVALGREVDAVAAQEVVVGQAARPGRPAARDQVVDEGAGHSPIRIRGPQVMRGYLNNLKATAEMLDDEGWLRTGDVGYADEDGYFYVVDRVKELIKYKGFQVAPAELEALLLTHPAVADAAVIPLADEEAGEVPKAYVVLKGQATEAALMAFVAERVAHYKHLRAVELVDQIPESASGKILRRVLVERERERAAALPS
jgi:acyl-CoA synthetase (AMP-forming)/AMP-acid ligase II